LRFLLTNDDGIDAPGLLACAEVLAELGSVSVVAPGREYSGCSHQVTVDRPLRLSERKPDWWTLDCTPADCVRVALVHLKLQIDWVIAGINPGGNLGADIYMSGTVAAVREAALWRKPGLALSQYRRSREPVDWRRAAGWSKRVLASLLADPTAADAGGFWNVNFPDPPDPSGDATEIVRCGADSHPMAVRYDAVRCDTVRNDTGAQAEGSDDGLADAAIVEAETVKHLVYRGRYQERPRTPGLDVDRCFSGAITLSRIELP
jgi:5'-nucleotidase